MNMTQVGVAEVIHEEKLPEVGGPVNQEENVGKPID